MDNADVLLGQILARLESLDRTVVEIRGALEKREERLRKVEDAVLKAKVWAAAAGVIAATLGHILSGGWLQKLKGVL